MISSWKPGLKCDISISSSCTSRKLTGVNGVPSSFFGDTKPETLYRSMKRLSFWLSGMKCSSASMPALPLYLAGTVPMTHLLDSPSRFIPFAPTRVARSGSFCFFPVTLKYEDKNALGDFLAWAGAALRRIAGILASGSDSAITFAMLLRLALILALASCIPAVFGRFSSLVPIPDVFAAASFSAFLIFKADLTLTARTSSSASLMSLIFPS